MLELGARCEGLPVDSPQAVSGSSPTSATGRHHRRDFLVVCAVRRPARSVVVPLELVEHLDAAAGPVLVRAALVPERQGAACSPSFDGCCAIRRARRPKAVAGHG